MNLTYSKQIAEMPGNPLTGDSEGRVLLISITHKESGLMGQALMEVEECPISVLCTIDDHDWDNPTLQNLKREALVDLRRRAALAGDVFAAADELLQVWEAAS